MKNGDLESAVSSFWIWISQEPSSPHASTALRGIFHSERALDHNITTLRNDFLSLADTSEDVNLTWTARKLAVQCLAISNEVESALGEYETLDREAPNEIERLFVQIDRLLLEEANGIEDGDDIDASGTKAARIGSLMDRIDELTFGGEKVGEPLAKPVSEFELASPFPNPFNELVQIQYTVPEASNVKLAVYDIAGRLVAELVNQEQESGRYRMVWNGRSAAAGLYVLRFEASGKIKTRKMLLVK